MTLRVLMQSQKIAPVGRISISRSLKKNYFDRDFKLSQTNK